MLEQFGNNLDFELILTKQKNNRFKATSPLFPKCKGFGNTKEEAIEKLCTSIANSIKETAKTYLQASLLSDNYSEVITNPEKKESFQHRVVKLEAAKKSDPKVYLSSIDNVFSDFSLNTKKKSLSSFNLEELFHGSDINEEDHESDDMILGINLCLN